jgi:hypothetical protein
LRHQWREIAPHYWQGIQSQHRQCPNAHLLGVWGIARNGYCSHNSGSEEEDVLEHFEVQGVWGTRKLINATLETN